MYERIQLSCECGSEPSRLREVGLSAERELVIYWRCSNCRRHMYIVKPLSDCVRECPTEDEETAIGEANDSRFLPGLSDPAPRKTA
jgi:hypothetical protein